MNVDAEAELMLLDVLAAEAVIAERPQPDPGQREQHTDWRDGRDHGPKWMRISRRAVGAAERMRAIRRLAVLEESGLVVCHRRPWSGRVDRVKLTPAGKKLASALRPPAAAE
jgi:hypothetical protein